MSNDYNMLSEAYNRIYLKEDAEFRDQMPSSKEEYHLGLDPDEVRDLEKASSDYIEKKLNQLTKKIAAADGVYTLNTLKSELSNFIRKNPEASALDLLDGLISDVHSEDAEETSIPKFKYTYEHLYAKYGKEVDPKTKRNVLVEYSPHPSGHPDIRHVFANSKEEALEKIKSKTPGISDLDKKIVIKKEEPADPKEIEAERSHDQSLHDYYHGPGSTNRYFGD